MNEGWICATEFLQEKGLFQKGRAKNQLRVRLGIRAAKLMDQEKIPRAQKTFEKSGITTSVYPPEILARAWVEVS